MIKRRSLTSLAIVVPLYNEEAVIKDFYKILCAELNKINVEYRLVFVDDGSLDNTQALLNEIADSDNRNRITVLSLARNFGHQIALTAGLDYVEADAVVCMDGDLQHPPSVIIELIQKYEEGIEIVYAVRKSDKNRGLAKQLAAKYFYTLFERLTNIDITYGAADFRLISRDALLVLRKMRETHRYLRGMVPWMGFSHSIVEYDERKRIAGESKYSWKQMARLAYNGLFSFSRGALHLITALGCFTSGLAFLYLVYILSILLFSGTVVPGWTSTIGVVLLASGIQLITIGFLAQYIGMIFDEVKRRPLYVLKQKRLAKFSKQVKTEGGT